MDSCDLTGLGRLKMIKNSGFTLVELVLVMAMLAVVGMMTIPQYVDASQQAQDQVKWEVAVALKNSHTRITDATNSVPTVKVLAESLNDTNAQAVSGGVLVQVDGESYTIPTYTNTLCNEPTRNSEDKVGCVGSIL